MQMLRQAKFLRNVLILAVLIGLVLFSWLLGHILRYSIPALWHPPIRETDPQIKVGRELELEGTPQQIIFYDLTQATDIQGFNPNLPRKLSNECQGYTYYTSLPAKCRTADGRLVQVRSLDATFLLIPQGK